jgi:hypothetical protein
MIILQERYYFVIRKWIEILLYGALRARGAKPPLSKGFIARKIIFYFERILLNCFFCKKINILFVVIILLDHVSFVKKIIFYLLREFSSLELFLLQENNILFVGRILLYHVSFARK